MAISITPTNSDYLQTIQHDATSEQSTNWTVRKDCKPGDTVLLYCCAPVQSIVARGSIATDPEQCGDINSPWFGHYFSEIESLQMLKSPITRQVMRAQFWEWRYWKQPRSPIQVPKEYERKLAEFVQSYGEPA